jgi:hypothetical protein
MDKHKQSIRFCPDNGLALPGNGMAHEKRALWFEADTTELELVLINTTALEHLLSVGVDVYAPPLPSPKYSPDGQLPCMISCKMSS